MAKVITTIVADGLDFNYICSFKTMNYVGIYSYTHGAFMLIERLDSEFHPSILPKCENLKELDEAVYNKCEEHIQEVFESNAYEFVLKTDD